MALVQCQMEEDFMKQFVRGCATLLALLSGAACAGQTQTSAAAPARDSQPVAPPAPPPTPSAKPDTSWLKWDSAGKTVTLSLVVTKPAGSTSGLINGHRSGEWLIVVPLRWTVKWDWRNDDPGDVHSLVVMTQREKIPLEGGRAAFSNAMSRSVTAGLGTGQTDQTTFEADEAGWYWLMCGVPNHALNGEWLELRVSPEAQLPGLQLKPR
jgi:hypothetical protein